jgi:hypothetical protein
MKLLFKYIVKQPLEPMVVNQVVVVVATNLQKQQFR